MDEISKLLTSMQSSLGEGVHLTGGVITETMPSIPDEEWQHVAKASPKRQREFSCGRYFGHQLLGKMGYRDFIIGRDKKGCPIWPEALAGSISHTSHYCVAIVAEKDSVVSVGIDLEESGRLKKALWPKLFTATETSTLDSIKKPDEQMRHAAIVFSAKEAFYKCAYPVNNQSYDFTEIEINLDVDSRKLQLIQHSSGVLDDYEGYYATGMTHVMTVIQKTR